MDLPLLKLGFILMSLFMVIIGGLINTVEQYLPPFLIRTFRYGKFYYEGEASILFLKPIEVPKRWFRHFYVFAAFFSTLATCIACYVYCFEGRLDHWFLICLDMLAPGRKASVSPLSSLLALVLITIQSWHRFYETWFISVFSDAKMNIAHYFVGYIHYFGSVAAILAESPGFISLNETRSQIYLQDITILNSFGTALFVWACYHQCKAGVILANLRKNHEGHVVSVKHKIPHGHWFEYISSPHLLTEILMYIALTCVLWGTTIWPWVFLWVLSNQVESALLTHWWYKSKFSNYPVQRKAILPFIL